MKRIKVGIGGNGKVRIKRRKREDERPDATKTEGAYPAAKGGGFTLPLPLLNQMEIRVESVFRPNEQDVEVVYALTGFGTSVDHLHKFSSSEVVAHATPEMVSYVAERMVEHIRDERAGMPTLIVHVHSHPLGAPVLSDVDEETMPRVAARIREIVPDATVLFGVHAVSSEERRPRAPPEQVSKNQIRWNSITRQHEVAFFDEDAEPVEVRVDW